MSRAAVLFVIAGGCTAIASSAFAITPIFSIAIKAGDNVTGVGNVTTIEPVAINNSGKWLVEADTNNANTEADGVMILDGNLHLREGQALAAPAGTSIGSFDAVNLNNNTHSGWNIFLDGATTTTDSGIFFDGTLVFQESAISTAPQFSAGTPYIGFFEATLNDFDQFMIVASVDDPAIASTVDRAMVRLDYNAVMGTYTETVVIKEGDLIMGNALGDVSTGANNSAFNNAGQMLYLADTTAATAVDGFLMRDTTVLAQEGTTSTSGPNVRMYETLLGRGLDMNDSGDWVVKANMTGDTLTDEAIIKNNVILYQEGMNIPAIGAFLLESFGGTSGPIEIDSAGNIVWYGDWNNPVTTMDAGIFWNDQLIVQEGVTVIGGLTVTAIANIESAFALSDDGRWLIFEGTGRDAGGQLLNTAFMVELVPTPGAVGLAVGAGLLGLRRRRA